MLTGVTGQLTYSLTPPDTGVSAMHASALSGIDTAGSEVCAQLNILCTLFRGPWVLNQDVQAGRSLSLVAVPVE